MLNIRIKRDALPELVCTPTSSVRSAFAITPSQQQSCTKRRRSKFVPPKKTVLFDENQSQVKITGPRPRHEAKALPKKRINELVDNMPINKLGPSLIPFAVTNKFLSPYKIFRKVRLQELSGHADIAGKPH
jgi:hypothetical protein